MLPVFSLPLSASQINSNMKGSLYHLMQAPEILQGTLLCCGAALLSSFHRDSKQSPHLF